MTRMLSTLVSLILLAVTANAGEYIVKTGEQGLIMPMGVVGIQTLDTHSKAHLVKLNIDDAEEAKVLKQLSTNPSVEYVVKNFKLKAFRKPLTQTALKEQWHIAKVNAEKAWNLAKNKGNHNVTVAVIDTGVDYNQESLKDNMVEGYDFKDNDNDPMDETGSANPGHGTHCAGIVGATGLVEGGVIGISPQISLMPLRFLGADGGGDLMAGIKAIDYAIEKGAKVISASWGATVGAAQAKPLIDAVQRASDAGVIFISAAANDGRSNDKTSVYPANAKFKNTITVAASDSSDAKPSWSNYGRKMVDLSAPGHEIMSTIPGNSYRNLSGTSMATPLVSGLVALLAAQRPNITGAEVRSLMQVTGAKVSIETACNCRVDAGAAMEALLNERFVVVPAAATMEPTKTLQFSGLHNHGPVTFTSSDNSIAEFDTEGLLTAKVEGEITVSATDADGRTAQSLSIIIAKASSGGGGGPGNPGNPGDPLQCPLDPQMCEIICGIMPDLPFCAIQ